MFRYRKIFSIAFLYFFVTQLNIAAQNKYEIIPGKSIGNISIGDCKDSVLKIIQSKFTEKTYIEEKESFADADLSNLPSFVLGFDKVFIFDDFPVYQVYKAYYQQDSLNCIVLTSYGFSSDKTIAKYKTKNHVGFLSSKTKVIKAFGEPDKTIELKNEVDFIYWSKGIEFVFEDDQVVVINIFKPIDKSFK